VSESIEWVIGLVVLVLAVPFVIWVRLTHNEGLGAVVLLPLAIVLLALGATLAKVMAEQVDMAASVLHTDAGLQYKPVGQQFIAHEWVDHSAYEYVRGAVTTNHAEGFFSQS
jgi:hypothetical protein